MSAHWWVNRPASAQARQNGSNNPSPHLQMGDFGAARHPSLSSPDEASGEEGRARLLLIEPPD